MRISYDRAFQFLKGGSLVFSQMYNGDLEVFIVFPIFENWNALDDDLIELGTNTPIQVTEILVIEKIDESLKEIIKWEIPLLKTKLGFRTQ